MPLPIGTWKANINGLETDLIISGSNAQNIFSGTLINAPLNGFWDEVSQTFSFSITINFVNAIPCVALFKGFLFRTPQNPAPGADVTATLTGSMQITVGDGVQPTFAITSSRRHEFGWFANIVEVL